MDKAIASIKLSKRVSSKHLQTLSIACIFFFLVRSFFFVALTKKKNEQRNRNYNTQNRVGE
jgi:preprotein translocase subunit SecG